MRNGLGTPASSGASRNRIVDPSRGQPYVDEWSVGYRAQLQRQVCVDTAFVRREYRNPTAAVNVNGIYDGSVFRGYRDETQNEIYSVAANRWNWQVYEGIELKASKRDATSRPSSVTRGLGGTSQGRGSLTILRPSCSPTTFPTSAASAAFARRSRWTPTLRNAHGRPTTCPGPTTCSTENGHGARRGGCRPRSSWFSPGPGAVRIVTRIAPDPEVGPPMVRLSNGRMVSNGWQPGSRLRIRRAAKDSCMLRC